MSDDGRPTHDGEDTARTDSMRPVPSAPSTASPLAVGTRVGAYIVGEILGTGASALVYRAKDPSLGRDVALKVLRQDAAPSTRERFLREVRVVAGISHPNVVSVFSAGESDGFCFAAMELLPQSLAGEIARRGRLPWDEALGAARDVCRGLGAAWKKGIVHRDVKPSNLLREEAGAVKVADFGLAKDLSVDLELTVEGLIVGTPLYVSPEQGRGLAVDLRADLYSLGATLYHLLAGRPPFHARTALDLIVCHSMEPPPPLGEDVPPRAARLVLALLDKEPARRPRSHEAVEEWIDDALEHPEEPGSVRAPRGRKGDALETTQLAAASAALEIGRTDRARAIYDRLYREKGAGWTEAALGLAPLLERDGDLEGSRAVLEQLAERAPDPGQRAFALWSLGKLAETESETAAARALEAYAKVLEVSETLFPKTLLEARMTRLRRRTRRDRS